MQSGSSQSFLRGLNQVFFMVGESQCITTGTLTTPSLYCIFADHLPLFLNTLNSENMSWHHARQCTESVALRQFSLVHMSRTMCKMTNSTHHTTVSSRPLFSFWFFSCTFLDPGSSINPTLHHLFSTHSSSSFSESISIPKHCKGASTSPQWFGKFFF